MNNNINTFNGRIGISRFKAEISPLINHINDADTNSVSLPLDSEFIARHNKDLDCFLLDNGYFSVYERDSCDTRSLYFPREDDPYDDIVPDFPLFVDRLNDILDDYDGTQAKSITRILYRNLYCEADIDVINNKKAEYLCEKLSTIFDIGFFDNGWETEISIGGIKTDLSPESLRKVEDMIIALGFLPNVSNAKDKITFVACLEDYINSGRYLRDGFIFGDAILRAYDEYIKVIDWFDHSCVEVSNAPTV